MRRFTPVRRLGLLLFSTTLLYAPCVSAAPLLRDAPVTWKEDDRRPIPKPEVRDPNLLWDGIDQTFFGPISRVTDPGRLLRRASVPFGSDHVRAAVNVNALDEVPNSSWFTNRIGLAPMSPEEVALGPGLAYGAESAAGPDTTGDWTVVRAKTEGVTPGFNIRDSRGHVYVIKFDDPRYPHMSSAAGVITGRLLHAAGYNVTADYIVYFERAHLKLGEKVNFTPRDGAKRPMTEADIDAILALVPPEKDGRWRALASRYLPGEPAGPFNWESRRRDDPNDRIDHEDRRELRGFRMFAAWLAHFDTKQGNTLDMWQEQEGGKSLRHYFIDFASTLGAGATGPFRTYSYEYSFDFPAIGGRLLSLGFHDDKWRQLRIPGGLTEVGYFQSDTFDPMEFKPLTPNASYANMTERDAYWAAKIISAFTNADLESAVATGQYENPEAARWIAQMLAERRDKIARKMFDEVPPLDFFRMSGTASISFHDLGTERGIYPGAVARYRARFQVVDAEDDGEGWSDWSESPDPTFEIDAPGLNGLSRDDQGNNFLAFEFQVNRGDGWSRSVRAWGSTTGNGIIAVEH
ncbi:MAG TPA: hypothetical protein VF720_16435 [Candidatus Eisenbacteria bacterium]